jgi:hypothetical protein
MEDKKIVVNAGPGTNEIVIREGAAINPRGSKRVIVTGILETPRKYDEKRNLNTEKALVIIDDCNENSKIILIADEHGAFDENKEYSDILTGIIEMHDTLKNLPVNNDKTMGLDELRIWVRKNAQLFASHDEHLKLTGNLVKFKGRVETIIEGEKDTRGNSKDLLQRTLESDLMHDFMLNVPILKGDGKHPFKVDICCEAKGNGVVFWFESNALKELIEKLIGDSIAAEKKYFEERGFCILYKAGK